MKKIIGLCSTLFFVSCMNINDNSALEQKIKKTISSAKAAPEPIKEYEEPAEFEYSANKLKSPFQPEKALLPIDEEELSSVKPEENRTPEALEKVRIENITMVGTLGDKDDGDLVALIRVNASGNLDGVHPIEVGDYVGQNHGQIISIQKSHIAINEIVSQGKNRWQNRARTIQLINQ